MSYVKIIAILLCVCAACSPPLQTAGGVTDTGNARVSATLHRSDGSRASNATVLVRPADFLAAGPGVLGKKYLLTKDTATDEAGRFQIESIEPGSYSIEINDKSSEAVLLTVNVRAGLTDTVLSEDTLKPYSIIQGSAGVPKSAAGKVIATVYGLQRFAPLDSTGRFTFSNLPFGALRVHVTSLDPQFIASETDTVSAVSGRTAVLPCIFWSHAKRVYFNTTSTGASVPGNVMNFPALVRLTATNFTFGEAQPGGSDLRFTKSDGTALPYEIERWDPASGQAEIWVKIDTVFGNDSTHFVNMHWGNPNAAGASNGAAVFDTLNGFQGVWHMNEATGQTAKDATANHFDGTPSGTAPSVIPGTIGLAQEFNGVSNYIQMRGTAGGKLNFSEPDTFTVSTWVYVDTLVDSTSHLIVGKGHQQYYLKLFFGPQGQHWEFTEFLGGTVWQITAYAPPVAKSWKFLFGMREGNTQFLYLDGVLVDANTSTGYPNAIKDTSNDVTIGRYLNFVTESNQGFAFFNGAIDEVRISNVSRSADWIKLCYMNQKEPDALVKW